MICLLSRPVAVMSSANLNLLAFHRHGYEVNNLGKDEHMSVVALSRSDNGAAYPVIALIKIHKEMTKPSTCIYELNGANNT